MAGTAGPKWSVADLAERAAELRVQYPDFQALHVLEDIAREQDDPETVVLLAK